MANKQIKREEFCLRLLKEQRIYLTLYSTAHGLWVSLDNINKNGSLTDKNPIKWGPTLRATQRRKPERQGCSALPAPTRQTRGLRTEWSTTQATIITRPPYLRSWGWFLSSPFDLSFQSLLLKPPLNYFFLSCLLYLLTSIFIVFKTGLLKQRK